MGNPIQIKEKSTSANNSNDHIPKWEGSGPEPGTIGFNDNSKSNKALLNYYPKNGSIEFVFDPTTNTFVVGKSSGFGGSPHEALAQSIGAYDLDTTVGGVFSRGSNGEIFLNDQSGHYWQNWTPEIKEQLKEYMNKNGFNVVMEF